MPTTDLYGEQSWGESLQNYAAQRTTLPWDKLDVHPAIQNSKINQNHAASKVYNPILMRFNDPAVEHEKSKEEADLNQLRLNVAKDKQLCYVQKFNVITNKSYLRESEATLPEKIRAPDSRVPYNIVSMYPKSAHVKQEIGIIPPDVTPRLADPNGGGGTKNFDKRPFDIVTNKYGDDHARRAKQDDAAARADAEAKFWATHNYDAVVGKYYSGAKEAEYQRQRRQLTMVHGAGQLARLPPSVQLSEGQAYDLVTQHPRDAEKLKAIEGQGNRRFNGVRGPLIEAELRQRSEDLADLEEDRRHERIARTGVAKAREEGRHHGFDVVTNEPFHGRLGKPLAPSRLRPPESAWAKLAGATATHASEPMGTSVRHLALAGPPVDLARAPRDLTRAHPPPTPPPASRTGNGGHQGGWDPEQGGYQGAGHGDVGAGTLAAGTMPRSQPGSLPGTQPGSGRPPSLPSARPSVRASARAQRIGGGATNSRAPTVPSLKMPSNITALQNNYE